MSPAAPSQCPQCGQPRPAGPWNGLCPACIARLSFGLQPDASIPSPAAEQAQREAGPRPLDATSSMRFGDYELLAEIGRGGMGIVYRARQIRLDRLVAVKMVPFGALAGDDLIRRFRLEAEAAAQLRHPNITAIHEVGEREGQHYFSMDYIEGGTLGDQLREGLMPARRAAHLLRTIAEAVHYAHEQGILHRDLKPSNILLDRQGRPHITDFGLARRLTGDSTLTLTGAVLGSPSYMPPEQASPERREPSPRSDIYSLGAILYRMVTGQPPFQGETVEALLQSLLTAEPVAPRMLNPQLPLDLETICLKCLQKEPARRYGSAQELADDLGRFLREEPIHARPVGWRERAWRWAKRRPALASILALLVVVIVAGLAGVSWQWRRAETAGANTRAHLYAADLELAYRAFAAGDVGRARQLLEAHQPGAEGDGSTEELRGWEWRYLWDRCRSDEWRTLTRHAGAVPALDISPDGRWVVSGDIHGGLTICDLVAGRPRLETNLQSGRINALSFSPDGKLLAHTTGRSEIWLWDPASWKPVGRLSHRGVQQLAFSADSRLLASANGADGEEVRLWNVETRQEWKRIPPGAGWPNPKLLAFAPDGRTLAIGDATRGVVVFWDWPSDREQNGVRAHRPAADGAEAMTSMAFSGAGLLATAGGDKTVRLRKISGRSFWVVSNHTEAVTSVAFSSDSRFGLSAGMDQFIRLWDVVTQREIASWHGHAGGCLRALFVPGGTNVVSSGVDGMVRLWNFRRQERDAPRRTLPSGVSQALIVPGARRLALGTHVNEWQLWDLDTLREIQRGTNQPAGYASLRGVDHGRILEIRADDDRVLQFRRLSDGAVEAFAAPARDHLGSLDLSKDGRMLAASGVNGVYAWEVPGGRLLRSWETPHNVVTRHVRVSPDGRHVVTLQESDGAVEFFEMRTGARRSLPGQMLGSAILGFSGDSRWLATSGLGGDVRIYAVAESREVAAIEPSRGAVSAVGFSPDDRRLACGTAKGMILLIDLATCREVAVLAGHGSRVETLAFLDADTLASSTLEEVRLWRAPALGTIAAK